MVLSVTLNPCIDKTIYLDNLEIGAYNRVKNTRVDLSGKGLNVSTVLNNLKEETMCMGLNFRESGNTLEHAMTARACNTILSVQRALSERISSFLTSPTTS